MQFGDGSLLGTYRRCSYPQGAVSSRPPRSFVIQVSQYTGFPKPLSLQSSSQQTGTKIGTWYFRFCTISLHLAIRKPALQRP